MQVQVARISPVVMELNVEVPAPDVKAEVEKAFATLQRKARVRGFRPGKAPRQVLARLYGPQVDNDVINALVNTTLPQALTEQKVTPVNQPQVEAGKFDQTAAFSYKARFEVQPEISEVLYEGLELVRPRSIADDTMVDEELERLRKQHARHEPPDPLRPAQKGDVVTIDYSLEVADSQTTDKGDGLQIELGSGQLLPELEQALVGRNVDDVVDVSAKLGDANPREEFRGKVATFHVKLKDVKQKVLPPLDDELAKDVGSFQTLVELRADVHTRLQKALKERADTALAEQIVDQLNAKNALEVPPTLVEQQRRMMEMEILQNARRLGQRPTQQDLDNVRDRLQKDAEKKVRAGLLMGAVARKLNLQVTDQDVQNALSELAEETGKNVAKLRVEYGDPQRRQFLLGMILEDKVLDVIESKATVRERDEEAAAGGGTAEAQHAAEADEARGRDAAQVPVPDAAQAGTESHDPASEGK
jgi:trigger factor